MAGGSKFRRFAFDLAESRWFSFSILAVIMLNTIFIAVQTSKYIVAKAGEQPDGYIGVCVCVCVKLLLIEFESKCDCR